jgi:predicted unusual protein kinase regulating ubiquinone biosynthesis (AarF/ABC1/UbiB family)
VVHYAEKYFQAGYQRTTTTMAARATRATAPALGKYARAARVATTVPFYRFQPSKRRYAQWLRAELEAAGCLFIKAGQWVASRPDIFPPDITAAFASLQKDVRATAMPPGEVRRILRDEGHELDDVGDDPVSCGSIAQVHTGVYRGERVAVKVQRPGLRAELAQDLGVVRGLLHLLRLGGGGRKSYDDAVKSLDDLGGTIARETDFLAEARHMRAFADFFAGSEGVRVPRVLAATPSVIVMEYVPSARVAGAAACPRLIDLFLTQFFELGRVHTDMHAGNLGVDERGRLVMYDFGSVLECPEGMRRCIKHLFVSYANRDPAVMLDYMTEYGVLRSAAPLTPEQRVSLTRFIEMILEYVETTDIRTFASARGIPVPAAAPAVEFQPEVFMVFRSFTLLEGLCKDLDPDFVIVDAALPYVAALLADPEVYRMKVEDDLRRVRRLLALDD